jgi:hypothetical protein
LTKITKAARSNTCPNPLTRPLTKYRLNSTQSASVHSDLDDVRQKFAPLFEIGHDTGNGVVEDANNAVVPS